MPAKGETIGVLKKASVRWVWKSTQGGHEGIVHPMGPLSHAAALTATAAHTGECSFHKAEEAVPTQNRNLLGVSAGVTAGGEHRHYWRGRAQELPVGRAQTLLKEESVTGGGERRRYGRRALWAGANACVTGGGTRMCYRRGERRRYGKGGPGGRGAGENANKRRPLFSSW